MTESAAAFAAKLQMQNMGGKKPGKNKMNILSRGFAEQQMKATSYLPRGGKLGASHRKASPFGV